MTFQAIMNFLLFTGDSSGSLTSGRIVWLSAVSSKDIWYYMYTYLVNIIVGAQLLTFVSHLKQHLH